MAEGILVAVTDHAAERYRQRVGTRTGSVDVKPEIVTRVSRAFAAGRTRVERGSLLVQDERLPGRHLRVPPRPRQPRAARRHAVGGGRRREGPAALHERPETGRSPGPRPAGSVSSEDPAILGAMPALGAILTAIITPFDAGGRVDEDAFVAVQQHVCATGSDGVVVAGTTGEAPTLSDEEHLRIIELAVANRPAGSTVVAGTGSNDTRHAVHLTQLAHGARGRRDPVRDAVLQPPDAARHPGPLRGGRARRPTARSSSTTSPRGRAPTCPTTCSPSSRSSTA